MNQAEWFQAWADVTDMELPAELDPFQGEIDGDPDLDEIDEDCDFVTFPDLLVAFGEQVSLSLEFDDETLVYRPADVRTYLWIRDHINSLRADAEAAAVAYAAECISLNLDEARRELANPKSHHHEFFKKQLALLEPMHEDLRRLSASEFLEKHAGIYQIEISDKGGGEPGAEGGFCLEYGAAWDEEHGMSVVVADYKVKEAGSGAMM